MHNIKGGVEKVDVIRPRYFVNGVCGTKSQTNTVRSWLEQFSIPAEDEFYDLWTNTLSLASEFLRDIEAKKATNITMSLLWSAVFTELYLNYDTGKELIPQFRENKSKLQCLFNEVGKIATNYFGGSPDE
jgi:hypothetical protein